jgi:hypothetical protein
MLSKKQMREVLENGATVLHPRGLITSVAQLSTLTGTDEERESERASLLARLAEIDGDGGKSKTEAADGGDVAPLPFDETMKRFEEMDFSDDVMRSMQIHQSAIKEKFGKSRISESNTAGEGGGSEEEIHDSKDELMRHTRAELAEMASEKKVEIGENDTKAQIIEKILGAGK